MSRRRADPVWVAFAASGAAGFIVGAFGYGTWQVAVESAQVLAGVVHYPRDNPFYMYHTKIWTLAHQVGALLLWSGLSEKVVSLLFSGLLGALSFQALALTSLALSRDVLVAIGTPFFVEYTHAAEFQMAYPVWLLGANHTYGILGLSAALLVVALVANGAHRSGAFALGLMPAVHPSIGAWLWLLLALVVASDLGRLREPLRRAARAFGAGVAVSAASLVFHLLHTIDVPRLDPAMASRTLVAFVRLYDGHRQPVTFEMAGVRLALGTAVLAALALGLQPSMRRPGSSFLLRFLVAGGVLGFLFILVSWVPPERVPEKLLILMPNRVLNLNVLAGVAVLIGLLAASGHWTFRAVLAGLLVLGAAVPYGVGGYSIGVNDSVHPAYHFVHWPEGWPLPALAIAAGAFAAAAIVARGATPSPGWLSPALRVVALSALAVTAVVTLDRSRSGWKQHDACFRDFRNDPLLAAVHRDPGVLATAADLHLVQLRTRRAVALDGGGLDFISYTLEAAPALDRVLRRLYGVDLFAPPPEVARDGLLRPEHSRAVWESRSAEEWAAVGRELGITGVLVYPDWTLPLRLVDKNDEFAYYSLAP